MGRERRKDRRPGGRERAAALEGVAMADIDPAPAMRGPDLLPAIILVVVIRDSALVVELPGIDSPRLMKGTLFSGPINHHAT